MNTIPSESDSNAILDRLLSGAGLHRDAQLAALLGVSPQAVSQARRKRKIPEGWVVKVSQRRPLRWIVCCRDSRLDHPSCR